MDVEAVVAKRLMDETQIKAFLSVPDDTPDEFLTVEMTSEGGDRFKQSYSLDVDVWGKDEHARLRTYEMAHDVMLAVPTLEEEPNIFSPKVTNCYRSADYDTGRMRYVVQIELLVCE